MITEAPIPKLVKAKTFSQELEKFIEYCNDFYNEYYGLYPIASSEHIEFAVGQYLKSSRTFDVEFDSIDREKVREILGY